MALMDERIAHGEEVLEAISENVRILKLLFLYKQGTSRRWSSSSASAARSPTRWLAQPKPH
jgi:hypothetical protein